MNRTSRSARIFLIVICFISIISFVSCSADMDMGNNTELSESFLDHLIANDYNSAYSLMENTVTPEDFAVFWATVKTLTDGATSYTTEQVGWRVNVSNGLTTRISAYQVYLDNGKTLLLRMTTRDDIEGIANLRLSDATAFLQKTNKFVPAVSVVFMILSLLTFAFVIWMFIDCLRRKIKHKVLWAILIFVGVAFTVTVGEQADINFTVGLMLQTNTITADPSILSVITKLAIPVGAIIYLCLRKKLTVIEPLEPIIPFGAPTENSTETVEEAPLTDKEQNSDEANE